jgi:hypothetical protein
MEGRALAQLRVIHLVVQTLRVADCPRFQARRQGLSIRPSVQTPVNGWRIAERCYARLSGCAEAGEARPVE